MECCKAHRCHLGLGPAPCPVDCACVRVAVMVLLGALVLSVCRDSVSLGGVLRRRMWSYVLLVGSQRSKPPRDVLLLAAGASALCQCMGWCLAAGCCLPARPFCVLTCIPRHGVVGVFWGARCSSCIPAQGSSRETGRRTCLCVTTRDKGASIRLISQD